MNAIKYLVGPAIIGVLALLMMVAEQFLGLFLISWAGFQAWALYFMAGGTVQKGAKAYLAYVAGIIAAIIIILGNNKLQGMFPGAKAYILPMVCGFVAFCVICFEKVPLLDFIPGWFVGAGAYFALAMGAMKIENYSHPKVFLYLAVTGLFGMVWGFVTVQARTRYGAMLARSAAKP